MENSATLTQKSGVVRDRYGRGFRTLRLSLTPDCNLACVYCVDTGSSETALRTRPPELTPEEYGERLRRIQLHTGLSTVRLTGGEPLLYRPIGPLIKIIKQRGIERVSLTTNASLLDKRLAELLDAGLDSINISLDTLNPETFRNISRGTGLERVLAGIEAAVGMMPDRVKLNMTVYRGCNENEIIDLLRFAGERGVILRYLELMNMGPLFAGADRALVTQAEILRIIDGAAGPLEPLQRRTSATANYWRTRDGQVFGVIANHSAPFCRDCDRLRMDSRGRLYGCLSENRGLDLTADESGDRDVLTAALKQKQDLRFTGSHLSMKEIGG